MSKISSSKLKNNTYKINPIIKSHIILKNTILINDLNNYGLAMKNHMTIAKSPIADISASLSMASKMIQSSFALNSIDTSNLAMKNYMAIAKSSIADISPSLSIASKMIQSSFALNSIDTSNLAMKNYMAIAKSSIADISPSLSIASKMIQSSFALNSIDTSNLAMKNYMAIAKSPIADISASLSMASKMIQSSFALNKVDVNISKFDTASDLLKINIIKNTFVSIADSLEDISYDELYEISSEVSYNADNITDISPFEKILCLIKNTSSQLRSLASPVFNLDDKQACKFMSNTLAGVIAIYSLKVDPYSGLFLEFLNKHLFSFMSNNCDGKDD